MHQQVQLAHAGHHQLVGLRVAVQLDRAVLLDDLVQRAGELAFVAAALGRDGQADHRRRELDRRQLDVAQRHAGVQLFDLGHGHDLAGPAVSIGCVSLACTVQQLVQLDGLARAGNVHVVVLLERAGVNRG